MRWVVDQNPRETCVLIGSKAAFDETAIIERKLLETPRAKERIRLLPACRPDQVWEYLCAADIFAFPSHNEGMPNSLLEAMAMGVPSIAFAIPSILEIDAGTEGIVTVPFMDTSRFAEAILRLASSPEKRAQVGAKGKAQVMQRFMVRKNMAIAAHELGHVVKARKKSCAINVQATL
jgi:glycosyltransferase involved in cell wall biosynthesis